MSVFFVTGDSLGNGSEELGQTLMPVFMNNLAKVDQLPDKIIMVNSGVKLVCNGSKALEPLKLLQDKGVAIVACGTCLDYYDLKEQVAVGAVTNALDVVTTLTATEKVVTI